jgi:beta-1,4-mannosyl-glycoprotein beta-1,4-N-acetylglucosaminyltransferase
VIIFLIKEFYQKECIKKPLLGLNDDDICFIGDLDEIWNPDLTYDIDADSIYKLKQDVYTGHLNVRSSESETWAGTMLTRYKNVKDACLNHLRTQWRTPYVYIENAGWHFTFIGGPDRIKTKLESYGHQEYNNDAVKQDIEYRLANNLEILGRSFILSIDEEKLPMYLKENKHQYKHLFK